MLLSNTLKRCEWIGMDSDYRQDRYHAKSFDTCYSFFARARQRENIAGRLNAREFHMDRRRKNLWRKVIEAPNSEAREPLPRLYKPFATACRFVLTYYSFLLLLLLFIRS